MFFIPLHGLQIPSLDMFVVTDVIGLLKLVGAVFLSVVTNGWVFFTFMIALVAFILATIDAANRPALLSDVNLPEHRGTMAGLAILANGTGFALGMGIRYFV